jgi:hypothetical protein
MFTNLNTGLCIILGIGIIALSFFILRIKFDNVIVETRGGKLLVFSVEFGKGQNQMEMIEEEKRKLS